MSKLTSPKHCFITLFALAFVGILAFGRGSEGGSTAEPAARATPPLIAIGPEVPHDVPGSQRLSPSAESNAILAAWAWQQFLAMSWQSNYNSITHERGNPDMSWDYSMPYTPGQPLVWQTYAHRSELRPYGVPTKPFDKAPDYLYELNSTTPIPAGSPGDSFSLFMNLDEDNEIGSCDVYLGSGDPATQPVVLYQAKVNRAEYDYIRTTFGPTQFKQNPEEKGYLDYASEQNLTAVKQLLPPPADGINLPAGDNTSDQEGAIEIKTSFLLIPDGKEAEFANFFLTEAIYYTADTTITTGQKDQYGNPAPDKVTYSNFSYHNGTFALLGMHVIHKTASYPDFIFTSFEHVDLANMDFEYILLSPLPPEYPGASFNPYGVPEPPPTTPDGSQIGSRVKIVRQTGSRPTSNGQLYPIPPTLDAATAQAHAQLRMLKEDSIWLNYKLIGVQANITESWAATPTADAGPNHFMANHVIESDAFLGNFFGPGFGSNLFPTSTNGQVEPGNSTGGRNGDNVLWFPNPGRVGQTANVGGCKGCHGVAQTSFGTDFSFLLDFGANKPVVNPDTIIYRPSSPG